MNYSTDHEWTIRHAERDDATEIARLFTQLAHPATADDVELRWDDREAAGNTTLVAARVDGRLLGVATLNHMFVLHRPLPVGRITALVVDSSVRGTGIGRQLVKAAEHNFAESGCSLLEITSNFRLTDAHSFYEHLGFERTSVRFVKDLLAAD